MLKNQIKKDIEFELKKLNIIPKTFIVETPHNKNFGDFSSNVAMVHAKENGYKNLDLAKILSEKLSKKRHYRKVTIAGGGFLNFILGKKLFYDELVKLLDAGKDFGRAELGKSKKVLIEFVSANPTGPLNIVNARAAAFGDTLSSIMEFVGFKVIREYYINDYGNQIDILAESIDIRFKEVYNEYLKEFPSEAYHGEYVRDIAKRINNLEGSKLISLSGKDRLSRIKLIALEEIHKQQKESLDKFGVYFDSWVSEKNLREKNFIEEALSYLSEAGCTYEKDDAIWFKSSQFGDEKDRILMKSDGDTTYFVPDIGYHISKYQRGYDIIVDVLGPDHHGYIPRLKAAVISLGYEIEKLKFIILQQVNIFEDEQKVKVSKRAGKIITLDALINAVGKDAARFFFLSRKNSSHINFDIKLAKSKSKENPFYYCQYANARINSVFKMAKKHKISLKKFEKKVLRKLNKEIETEIINKLLKFPEIVINISKTYEISKLTNYLYELATIFHKYYTDYKIVRVKNVQLSQARLFLLKAIKQIFENTFKLMGIKPMEKM